ncbi:cadherin-23-like isoform X2 [Centruroides vittatus]|uniref:cadherin-23-like isoform X2 n=1 Tax=Centruroides vittatus TaxID=120091 RepID=UPI0035102EE6
MGTAKVFKDLKSHYEFREDFERDTELFNFTLTRPVLRTYFTPKTLPFKIKSIKESIQFSFVLNENFDYSITTTYDFVIIAEVDEENYTNKAVQIEVIKVNKYKPYFLQYNDTINLEEEKIHGDVLSILAKDDDKKDFIKCYFENRDKLDSKFSLNQTVLIEYERPVNNVTLKNIEKLDYESITSYRIVIIVKDNQHKEQEKKLEGTEFSDKAIIYVNVVDIDDQNPTFIKDCGVQRINEHYKGTVAVVHAIDGDRGINNPIQYRIDENLQSSYFGMGKSGENGILFVETVIDRENEAITNNPILTVNIIAEEYYENGTRAVNRTTISTCTIIILDINDNKPKFNEKHYEASVKENTQIGIPITLNNDLIPKVSDIDEGKNAKFKLYLEDHEGIFAITPTQGINDVIFMIRVNKSEELDYEREDLLEPKQFNFKIIAEETETEEGFSSVVDVTVNLEDVNDNFPQFSSADVAYVYENASKGDFATSINATDIDSGYYGTKGIRYRLIPNYISDSFQIDSETGDLRVSKDDHGFDYEKIQDYYLTIEARDENGTGNANTTQLHIVILDVNDNAPKFCYENYSGYLMENSEKFTDILQVQATDADEPNSTNSIVKYQIIHDAFEQFTIDPVEGVITPNSSLDFEDDEPPVNDNCITICTKTYFLKVMAYDLGIPRQSSEVSVYITLMDENDNVPEFDATTCDKSADINETSVGGTHVAQVYATDKDKSPMFSNVSYTIIDGAKNNFIIDRTRGNITVAYNSYLNITDDKSKLSYELKIEATDAMMKKEDNHFCKVYINVKDINDIPPKFKYVASTGYKILENVNDKRIGLFEAIDPDETKQLKYFILFNKSEALQPDMISPVNEEIYNFTKIFNITDEGEVWVVNPADREEMKSIDLTIKVVDVNGEINIPQEDEMRFRIIIEDVNDNDPYFVNNNTLEGYVSKVFENVKNIMLLTIQAKDIDENHTIVYTLEKDNDAANYFDVNEQTGELRIIKPADYEEIKWLNVTVFATDSGVPSRNASALVTIEILDENDNTPQFIDAPYTAEIKEHEPNGTFVIKINATDADSGEKGTVYFKLSDLDNDDHYFQMEKETGKITVLKDLDREIQEIYTINVQAYDNPFDRDDQNINLTQVKITLIDINDNKPEIKSNEGCWRIPETHGIKEDIGIITATDRDKEGTPNSKIEFFIINSEYFDITLNGTLFVKSSLENLHEEFSIEVMAKDKGEPPLNSTQEFCVFVYDMNTYKPEFTNPQPNEFPKKVYTSEDSDEIISKGRKLIQIQATDKDNDKTTNGNVSYTIIQDDPITKKYTEAFKIDPDGIISVNTKLKKSEKDFYEIIVKACDNGKPKYCADVNAIIHVYVTNEIDDKPKFNEREIHANFTEHSIIGEEQFTIPEAILIDDDNITICYFIVGGNASLFHLDKNTRILTIAKELDREESPFHYIIVKAQIECSRKPHHIDEFKINQPDLINITIRVLDINDNAPEFIKPNFTGGVKAKDRKGKNILTITATDKDEGENAIVTYHVISDIKVTKGEKLDGIRNYFLLNETTGKLALAFQPTFEMKGQFSFNVMAKDKDSLNDTAKVLIYLMREDQQIKIWFSKNVNQFTQEDQINLQEILQSSTQFIVNIDDVSAYSGNDLRYKDFTEVLMHLVNPKSNEVIEANEAISIIDRHYTVITAKTRTFVGDVHIDRHTTEKNINKTFWEEQESYILVATIGTLIFCMLLLLIVYYIRISSYKRLLKAATAKAYTDANDYNMTKENTTIVPNTNLHAMQVSNPIWNQDEIVNKCFSEEAESDNGSQNSLDINDVEPNLCNNGGKDNPIFIPDNENGEVKSYNSQQMDSLNVCDEGYKGSEKTINLNKMDLLKAVDNNWRRKNSKNDFNTNLASAPSFQDGDLY